MWRLRVNASRQYLDNLVKQSFTLCCVFITVQLLHNAAVGFAPFSVLLLLSTAPVSAEERKFCL